MDRVRTDEHIAHIGARQHRGEGYSCGPHRFHVFRRVDREIDFAGKQPGIEFLGPQRRAADFGQRAVLNTVTTCGNGNQLDGCFAPPVHSTEPGAGFFGLSKGKRGAAGAQFQGAGKCAGHGSLC